MPGKLSVLGTVHRRSYMWVLQHGGLRVVRCSLRWSQGSQFRVKGEELDTTSC
jgi:hypothetical protein